MLRRLDEMRDKLSAEYEQAFVGAVSHVIRCIDPNADRGGLKDTPTRVAKAWIQTWGAGYGMTDEDIAGLMKEFDDGGEGYDELVVVRDIPFYSHCEHHLAPFFGTAHVGYLPAKSICGLSKFPRVVEAYARRLQVQERLTRQVADAIQRALRPRAVAVVVEARHLCMESRGVRTPGATTVTSAMLGLIKDDDALRAEFLRLIGK